MYKQTKTDREYDTVQSFTRKVTAFTICNLLLKRAKTIN